MMSLPAALALSVRQLGDPAILKVLFKTALATLAIFTAGGAGLYVLVERAIDSVTSADTFGMGALVAAAGMVLAGWFLFRVVALFVLGQTCCDHEFFTEIETVGCDTSFDGTQQVICSKVDSSNNSSSTPTKKMAAYWPKQVE